MKDLSKGVLAILCAACGFLFGDMNGIMVTLIVLIVLDYITGVLAAAVEHKLSSEIGAKGIAKKVLCCLSLRLLILSILTLSAVIHTR